jgi:hypothetical protein
MSCDWDVYCVDCDAWCGIGDANQADELMRVLIKHSPVLAALALLNRDGDVQLRVDFKFVDVSFFEKHGRHTLRPRNEYNEYDTLCGKKISCSSCGEVICDRREHPDTQGPGEHWHITGTGVHFGSELVRDLEKSEISGR